MDLKDKVAFITGGGGYIGSAIAIKLASLGVNVAVCDINYDTAVETVREIEKAGGTAMALTADVTRSESIDAAIHTAYEQLGSLGIMIHVAGGSAREKIKPLIEQENEVIERVLNINLLGAIYASRAAAKIMVRQNAGGRIINFSSTVGVNGLRGCVDYAAAKGGVIAMTKALAKELGEYKITVNSIAPGIVMRPEESGGDERALNTNYLHSKCFASDVAELAAFLVSEKARFITGQTCIIDGGRSLGMKGSD
jgi:NAD(P)-dependent dehydrogenase (short-subunit alcohol dehydrogenase family)